MNGMRVFAVLTMLSVAVAVGYSKDNTTGKSKSEKDKVLIRLALKSEVGDTVDCVTHGQDLTIQTNTKVAEYHGTNYYFCTVGEDVKFAKNPDAYLKAAESGQFTDMSKMDSAQDKKSKEKGKEKDKTKSKDMDM